MGLVEDHRLVARFPVAKQHCCLTRRRRQARPGAPGSAANLSASRRQAACSVVRNRHLTRVTPLRTVTPVGRARRRMVTLSWWLVTVRDRRPDG
jgi:hypothetical protein